MITGPVVRNPELRRQLWLELSPLRLLGMPAVLGLVFAAVALVSAAALPGAAQTVFAVLVWADGARRASAALLDEVAEATWDAQRLSSLTPWQLTAGKLFGGTAYAWYGGAVCLVVWWASSAAQGQGLPWRASIAALAVGVGAQAVSLILALIAVRRRPAGARRGGAWWVVLLIALPWLGSLPFQGAEQRVVWWDVQMPASGFFTAMAVVFALWAVLGAQRLMAVALQVPLRPAVWLAFLLWLAVFAAGFEAPGGAPWRLATALTAMASAAAYVALFVEPPRLHLWRRFAAGWRAAVRTSGAGGLDGASGTSDASGLGGPGRLGGPGKTGHEGAGLATLPRVPLVAASIALALLAGALASVLGAWAAPWSVSGVAARLLGAGAGWGLPAALALLSLRDVALACAVHWHPAVRRPEGALLVLLALLHLVLPWLAAAAGAPALAGWLQPLIGAAPDADAVARPALAVGVAALQAAIAIALAAGRWRAAARAGGTP